MAVTKEAVLELLNKEGTPEEKAGLVFDYFNENVNGLLINSEKLKQEKEAEKSKRKAVEENLASMVEKNSVLEKQLSDNSPDTVKKLYESKLNEQQTLYEGKLKESLEEIEKKSSYIKHLENESFKLECMETFNKAVAGKNIAPDCMQQFADFVMGKGCVNFSRQATGADSYVIADENGQSIDSAVKKALDSTFGKFCVVMQSSGGGSGGTTMQNNNAGGKIISRSNFEALSPSEKQRYMEEGFRIG